MLLTGAALLLGACQQEQLVNPSALASQSRGHAFGQASCAACHGIERDSILSPNPRAPSFPAIVNQRGVTADTLSSWLRNAHNYPAEMEFQLDASKVDDLVAYMLTLRDPKYKPAT